MKFQIGVFAALAFLPFLASASDHQQRDASVGLSNEIAPMVIIGEGWSVQLVIQNMEDTSTAGVLRF